jgi:hypothetical protein
MEQNMTIDSRVDFCGHVVKVYDVADFPSLERKSTLLLGGGYSVFDIDGEYRKVINLVTNQVDLIDSGKWPMPDNFGEMVSTLEHLRDSLEFQGDEDNE